MSLGKKANMFRRIQLRTAGAVVALIAAPLGVLSSQTPQSAPTTGQTPPINPPVIQNPTTPKSSSGDTGTTSSRAEVAADSNFIRDAVAGNLLEVRLGTIARDKAADGDVKAFGRRMVSQHSTMRDQWLGPRPPQRGQHHPEPGSRGRGSRQQARDPVRRRVRPGLHERDGPGPPGGHRQIPAGQLVRRRRPWSGSSPPTRCRRCSST